MEKQKAISLAEKRWYIREISSGRMTIGEVREQIKFQSKNPRGLIYSWQKQFASEIEFTLPVMTGKEKQKLDAAQKRMKKLEKQLEDAQVNDPAYKAGHLK